MEQSGCSLLISVNPSEHLSNHPSLHASLWLPQQGKCLFKGTKKAHLSMSLQSLVWLTYTSRHYITNLTGAFRKVKFSSFIFNKFISTVQCSQSTLHVLLSSMFRTVFCYHLRPRVPIEVSANNRIHPLIHDFALALHV